MSLKGYHLGEGEVKAGELSKFLQLGSATGPAADVSIAAGATGTIDISVTFPISFDITPTGFVAGFSALPAGLEVIGLETTAESTTGMTVRITVNNPTAAAITVTAGSVTAKWIAAAIA